MVLIYTDSQNPRICAIDDCYTRASLRGWCSMHYHRWQRHGNPLTVKREKFNTLEKCLAVRCTKRPIANGLCARHYGQIRNNGKVKLTYYDEYFREPEYFSDRKEYVIGKKRAIFDLDFTAPHNRPQITQHGYVKFGKKYAHRLVMNTPRDMETDHVNHDRLDNRKSNLRICTPRQHAGNRPLASSNKSGYLGVHWAKTAGKWCAQITQQRKTRTIGYFDTALHAAIARDEEAKKIWGEFASLNFQ